MFGYTGHHTLETYRLSSMMPCVCIPHFGFPPSFELKSHSWPLSKVAQLIFLLEPFFYEYYFQTKVAQLNSNTSTGTFYEYYF